MTPAIGSRHFCIWYSTPYVRRRPRRPRDTTQTITHSSWESALQPPKSETFVIGGIMGAPSSDRCSIASTSLRACSHQSSRSLTTLLLIVTSLEQRARSCCIFSICFGVFLLLTCYWMSGETILLLFSVPMRLSLTVTWLHGGCLAAKICACFCPPDWLLYTITECEALSKVILSDWWVMMGGYSHN